LSRHWLEAQKFPFTKCLGKIRKPEEMISPPGARRIRVEAMAKVQEQASEREETAGRFLSESSRAFPGIIDGRGRAFLALS